MPQVPYTGVPSVGGAFVPRQPVSPVGTAAFQGALEETQAASNLGRALEHFGDEIFHRATAMQQLEEQAAADNSVTALTEKAGLRLEQYRSLSGIAAKDGYEGFVADISKLREEGAAGLSSPYAKQLYDRETRQMHSRLVLSAANHAGTEFKNYQIGTAQSNVNNAIDQAMIDPTDDTGYKASLAKIDQSVATLRELKGWSPEQEADYKNQQKSKLTFQRATTLARTDPKRAQEELDKASKAGLISGEEYGRAQEFIRHKRNGITTRVEADALMNGDRDNFSRESISLAQAREAIAAIESSGNYTADHPTVVRGAYAGQHALGRYAVMQGNLPGWLKEAGMPAMSEAEFLRDHAAQDKLFDFKFGQLMRKYNSAQKAAMVWFTGTPDPKPGVNDDKTTAPQYLKRFNSALARNASPEQRMQIAKARAQEIVPDDPEFEYNFVNRVQQVHNLQTAAYKEELRSNVDVLEAAIVPAKDGKLVSSPEDLTDPEAQKAWDWMQMHEPKLVSKYNALFARNSKGDYASTPSNQLEFNTWLGRLTDPTMSDQEREAALNTDFATMHMPAEQRARLIRIKNKLVSGYVQDPNVGHAMQVLEPQLVDIGLTKADDEENYMLFKGVLHDTLQTETKRLQRPLKDAEVIDIGRRLLRNKVTRAGFLWDTKGPAFEEEVPDKIKERFIEAYSSKYGAPPTEQVIKRAWAVKVYNELYAKRNSNVAGQ